MSNHYKIIGVKSYASTLKTGQVETALEVILQRFGAHNNAELEALLAQGEVVLVPAEPTTAAALDDSEDDEEFPLTYDQVLRMALDVATEADVLPLGAVGKGPTAAVAQAYAAIALALKP